MQLIDADALKLELQGHFETVEQDTTMSSEFQSGALMGLEAAEFAIRCTPSIDAAPVVHGRWVKMTGMMPPEYHGHYNCSECGWHMKGLRNSWTREEELSYCPNCGAKMDGGEKDGEQ